MWKEIGKGTAAIIGGIIVLLVVALLWVFGVGTFQRKTADFRGKTSAIEKTKANADFRLGAYNQFFDLCGAVQSVEDRIDIASKAAQDGQYGDQSTLLANVTALRSQRSILVREYNQKASRGFTEGQFRDSKLPYHIDPAASEGTVCEIK